MKSTAKAGDIKINDVVGCPRRSVSLTAQVVKGGGCDGVERALGILECKLVWASDSLEPKIYVPCPFTGSTWPPPRVLQLFSQPRRCVRLEVPISLLHGSLQDDQPQQAETEMELSWKAVCFFPVLSGSSAKRDPGLPWKLPGHHQCVPCLYFFHLRTSGFPGIFLHTYKQQKKEGRWEVQTPNLSGKKAAANLSLL